MECVQNLLLGDPVYDERGQLVRREYGLKNALALFVLGYIAYTLYLSMGKKVFSGKRKGKMKGGGSSGSSSKSDDSADMSKKGKAACVMAFLLLMIGFSCLFSAVAVFGLGWPPTGENWTKNWYWYLLLGVCILIVLVSGTIQMKSACKIW
jgi:hypothetical protein